MKKLIAIIMLASSLLAWNIGNLSPTDRESFTRDNTKQIVTDSDTQLQWQDDSDTDTVQKSWQGAVDYCEASTLGGYDDWRLPTRVELFSIADKGKSNPAINSTFANISSSTYWSSTSLESGTSSAWVIHFGFSGDGAAVKSESWYVRCVRGGQSIDPLILTRNNTSDIVSDLNTNLQWQDDSDAKIITKTWQDAQGYCDSLSLGGYDDWRLPNINELYFITDDTTYKPATSPVFANISSSTYWSSTTRAFDSSYAWGVDFNSGDDYLGYKSYNLLYVRCVRAGQSIDTLPISSSSSSISSSSSSSSSLTFSSSSSSSSLTFSSSSSSSSSNNSLPSSSSSSSSTPNLNISASFIPSVNKATPPAVISFYDVSQSEESISYWSWSVKDTSGFELIKETKTDSDDKDFEYKFTKSGDYTISLTITTNQGNSNTFSKNVTLQDAQDVGEAIILAGQGDDISDTLHIAVYKLSTMAYSYFKLRGFSDDAINFMYGKEKVDVDVDGFDDGIIDDKFPNATKFYQAITDLSTSSSSAPLYIYMIDHGARGAFQISKSADDGIVYATKLDEALTTFQDATNREVVLVIEACYSGSFYNTLMKHYPTKRALYLSSNENQLSYLDAFGGYAFSKYFFRNALSGKSIHESYLYTLDSMQTMRAPFNQQLPVFNNTIPTTFKNIKIGGDFVTASIFPTLFLESNETTIDWKSKSKIELKVKVQAVAGVSDVWAVVIPPDYDDNTTNEFDTPDLSSYKVTLTKSTTDESEYILSYPPAITLDGEYGISIYVQDKANNIENISTAIVATNGETPLSSSTLTITQGWNLLALPVDVNVSYDELNSTFQTAYTIWKYENNKWHVYIKKDIKVPFDKITSISKEQGFWVNNMSDANVSLSGKSYETSVGTLASGWHLLGAGNEMNVSNLENNNIQTIWTYENSWRAYSPNTNIMSLITQAGITPLESIKQAQGFWVNVK